jgi:choline dehydrogenase-like flavoprotein
MQQNNDNLVADIAIIGGGLAGLSLAAELAAPAFAHLQVIIIEPRAEYVRDRTWSYWRKNPHDYSNIETATWPAWCVKNSQNSALIGAENAQHYLYASINRCLLCSSIGQNKGLQPH